MVALKRTRHAGLASSKGFTLVEVLIVMGIIAWLLYFLIDYCNVPEPINKVLRVVLMILIVIVLINFLLSIVGHPLIVW